MYYFERDRKSGRERQMLNRRESREAVFEMVYELDFNRECEAGLLLENAIDVREIEANGYIKDTFLGVASNLVKIDELIKAKSEGWNLDRISKVSMAAMRLCTYEIMCTDIPFNIAINEALELVKKYDDEMAKGFVNGILNAIAAELGKK